MNKVSFNEKICKGCALCVDVCPKKIIALSGDKLNDKGYSPACVADADMPKCIACAMCAKICPDIAITVEKEDK